MARPSNHRRHHRRKRTIYSGKPNGIQPGDAVGNRKPKAELHVVPDDIGNRRNPNEEEKIPPDDIGNRVAANPTHDLSGLLPGAMQEKAPLKRRRVSNTPYQKVGRYLAGGVNPIVSSDANRSRLAQNADDELRRNARLFDPNYGQEDSEERRLPKYFNLVDDDRYRFKLKSTPEEKLEAAETLIQNILRLGERPAKVKGHCIEDGSRPKLLITIDEDLKSSPAKEEGEGETQSLKTFSLGNMALMSLNYVVNKVINDSQDDRIRLIVLPKEDEAHYRSVLEAHQQNRPEEMLETSQPEEASTQTVEHAETASKLSAMSESTRKLESEPNGASSDDTISIDEFKNEKTPEKKAATKKVATKKVAKKKVATKKVATKKVATKKVAKKKVAKKKVAKKKVAKKKVAKKKAATKKAATKKATTKKATTKKSVQEVS